MNLSEEAKTKLRLILQKEIGPESVEMLNESDLNEIGLLCLSIFAESLKLDNH